MKTKILGNREFDQLAMKSMQNDRGRLNINLHDDLEDPFQRMVVAIQPDSYVIPHRHSNPAKPECFVGLKGSIGLIIFDESGEIVRAIRLGPNEENQVCDLAAGTYHTAIALEPNSVFLEAKPGPYSPISTEDVPAWAPASNSATVRKYQEMLYGCFTGHHACDDSE